MGKKRSEAGSETVFLQILYLGNRPSTVDILMTGLTPPSLPCALALVSTEKHYTSYDISFFVVFFTFSFKIHFMENDVLLCIFSGTTFYMRRGTSSNYRRKYA